MSYEIVRTDEVVGSGWVPAIPEPETATLPEMRSACEQVTVWAESCDDLGAVREVYDRFSAVAEYMRRNDAAALGEATKRRLEVRIGQLLGPAKVGPPFRNFPREGNYELPKNEASRFRRMAAHPDTVEHVIAESDDTRPASRRKVLEAIDNLEKAAREAAAFEQDLASSRQTFEEIRADATRSRGWTARDDLHRQRIEEAVFGLGSAVDAFTAEVTPEEVAAVVKGNPLPHMRDQLVNKIRRSVEQLGPYWEAIRCQ